MSENNERRRTEGMEKAGQSATSAEHRVPELGGRVPPTNSGPSWKWVSVGVGVAALVFLGGCLLAYSLGFIQLPEFAAGPLTQALSPEQAYAQAIGPALTALEEWETEGAWAEFVELMASPAQDGESYSWMLDYCLLGPRWCEQGSELRDMLSEAIIPAATKVGETGMNVKSAFSVESVPQPVAAQHSQIVSCIDYRIELTTAIVEVLRSPAGTQFPDLGRDPCTLVEQAEQAVADFVEQHSP